MSKNKPILPTVFLTIFIDMLGIGILIPVFPMLVTHGSEFCITPANWTQGQSYIMSGWLLAVYPLLQFIFSPILGQLSDRYGRRKLLLISIAGTATSYALFAYAILSKNIYLLFISRMIDGISGGNIATAQAVIGDVSTPQHRARNFGMIGVSIGVGFVFGPFIGGILSSPQIYHKFNAATPFWFTCVLSLLNCYLIFRNLPETVRNLSNNHTKVEFTRAVRNIIGLFHLGKLSSIIPVLFLFNFGFTFFTSFWGIVLVTKFDYNQSGVGYFFAYLGIMIIFAQGGVVRRISGKVNEIQILKIALFLTGFCLLMYYLVPLHAKNYIYLITPFLALGTALVKSFSSALITRIAAENKLGEAMGINSSASALAQALPALLAGYVAYFHPELSILVGAIVALSAWVVFKFTSTQLSVVS